MGCILKWALASHLVDNRLVTEIVTAPLPFGVESIHDVAFILGHPGGDFSGRGLGPGVLAGPGRPGGPGTGGRRPSRSRPARRRPGTRPRERPRSGRQDSQIYDQLAKEYEQFAHVNRMFELVAKAVSPTVVHIVAEKTSRHEESQRVRKFEETGSGVIVRGEKNAGLFVLTNHHVVEGGKTSKIRIFLHDGRTLSPERIWSDAKADIAVLKLDRDDLPAARLGNSDTAVVGTWVLALGSPFGLMHSVSQGIISARGRHMDELAGRREPGLPPDRCGDQPGQLGGPAGEHEGRGDRHQQLDRLQRRRQRGRRVQHPDQPGAMDHERADRPRPCDPRGAWAWTCSRTSARKIATNLGLDRPQGALIDKVHPESPAARGGLRDGDVILRFGGVEIHDLNHLINTVSMTPVGVPAEVIIWRDRKESQLQITVGDRDRTLTAAPGPATRPGSRSGRADPPSQPARADVLVRDGPRAGHAQSPDGLAVSIPRVDAGSAHRRHRSRESARLASAA